MSSSISATLLEGEKSIFRCSALFEQVTIAPSALRIVYIVPQARLRQKLSHQRSFMPESSTMSSIPASTSGMKRRHCRRYFS